MGVYNLYGKVTCQFCVLVRGVHVKKITENVYLTV